MEDGERRSSLPATPSASSPVDRGLRCRLPWARHSTATETDTPTRDDSTASGRDGNPGRTASSDRDRTIGGCRRSNRPRHRVGRRDRKRSGLPEVLKLCHSRRRYRSYWVKSIQFVSDIADRIGQNAAHVSGRRTPSPSSRGGRLFVGRFLRACHGHAGRHLPPSRERSAPARSRADSRLCKKAKCFLPLAANGRIQSKRTCGHPDPNPPCPYYIMGRSRAVDSRRYAAPRIG